MSSHAPVCARCGVAFVMKLSGITVLDTAGPEHQPYQLWYADIWECPKCQYQAIMSFGLGPYSEHHKPGFQDLLAIATRQKKLYVCYERKPPNQLQGDKSP